jgi:predicted transposase YdaD
MQDTLDSIHSTSKNKRKNERKKRGKKKGRIKGRKKGKREKETKSQGSWRIHSINFQLPLK